MVNPSVLFSLSIRRLFIVPPLPLAKRQFILSTTAIIDADCDESSGWLQGYSLRGHR